MDELDHEYEKRVGFQRQALKDEIVAAVSFGIGAGVCAVVAFATATWWMWLVGAGAAACCAVTALVASRKSR